MSVISSTHSFVKLDRSTSALSGQRLSKLIAKADRNGNYPSPNLVESLAVSVPLIGDDEIVEAIDLLIPHMKNWLAGVQDSLIREFRVEHGRNEIPQEAFAIPACIAYLEEASAGDRVTKEWLAQWFVDSYGVAAQAWITSLLPALEEEQVLGKIAILRDMFSVWASPKASPNIPTLKSMLRFTHHLAQSGGMCARMSVIAQRAHALLTKKEAELSADALGF